MQLTNEELDLCRQWFDSVQDLNSAYLTQKDYMLAVKLYEKLGLRVPNSVQSGTNEIKVLEVVKLIVKPGRRSLRSPVGYIEIPSSELGKIGGKK